MPPPESPKDGDAYSLGKVDSPGASKHDIDTASPFGSVKDAVSKFGGRVDWKCRRTQSMEQSKLEAHDFAKTETAEELESTKKHIDELKHNLERVESDELQAKKDAELVSLKIEEMQQDIVDTASTEAKAQLEVEKSKHAAVVLELELIEKELESMRKEYASTIMGRDEAVKKAEEAAAASKEVEIAVENLTSELITTKESLESTRTTHLEAEEQRMALVDQGTHNEKLELEQVEEELKRLNQLVLPLRVLKSKLDASSTLLLDLKAELAAYTESKLKMEGDQEELTKELEDVKLNIEKAAAEINCLREASMSLKSELEEEKPVLTALRDGEEAASAAILTLKAELDKTRKAIALLEMKEKEAREMMINELPEKLKEVAKEAEHAKSLAHVAQVDLLEAKEEAEQAKATATTMESRLIAAQKELEAANVSEKLAKDAINALEKSDSPRCKNDKDCSSMVELTMEEYQELSKRSSKAEEELNVRVAAANSKIEIAKESELRSLEKLEELNEELSARKESLKIAIDKAEEAKEGKLAVEQELRTWRDEQEQQRKDDELNQSDQATDATTLRDEQEQQRKDDELNQSDKATDATMPVDNSVSTKANNVPTNDTEAVVTPEMKSKKKKKKSLFPKVAMFFAKRKTHPSK